MAELVDPPFGISRDRKVVLEDGMVVGTMPSLNPFQPASPEPPKSSHISVIDVIDTIRVRPVRIKRVWKSKDYFYDCLVTESVKDQYVAGDVAVGDYVLVHFDDIGEQIVIAKVFKSW